MINWHLNASFFLKPNSLKKYHCLISLENTPHLLNQSQGNLPLLLVCLLSFSVWLHKFHKSLSSCDCYQNVWMANVNIYHHGFILQNREEELRGKTAAFRKI